MAGPKFKSKVSGLDRLVRAKNRRKSDLVPAVESALFVEGEETITAAKRITPVDEGVLRSSGHVRLPVREGSTIVVECGFGGPAGTGNQGETQDEDVGYAVFVHEDLTAHHTVGQAKYLEVPVNARRATLPERIAERVDAKLGD